MDTSETYIKMSDCEEIQDKWRPSLGDFYYKPPNPDCPEHGQLGLCTTMKVNYFGTRLSPTIWLPTQSRLQEMVTFGGYPFDAAQLAGRFGHFCNPQFVYQSYPEMDDMPEAKRKLEVQYGAFLRHKKYIDTLTSMEQLWLAFVMKEKYEKIWNGEEWE